MWAYTKSTPSPYPWTPGYKYPVDAKRVNEYGFSAEEGPKEGEEGAQPALEGAEGIESIGEGEAKKDK